MPAVDTKPADAAVHGAARTSSRATAAWVAALLVVTALTLPWSVQRHWDAKPDGATYLIAARSLARGEGYSVMGEAFTLRPPGWSVLLMPLVAWRGLDFTALNLAGSLFGVLAVVLFFLLIRPRVGAPAAFAAALLVWLSPGYQQLLNQVLSDVPGLAAALAALLVLRWSDRGPSLARDLVLGLVIAAASYLRTANLLLLPALVLHRLLAPPLQGRLRQLSSLAALRRILVPVLVAGALYAPWALRPATPLRYSQESLRDYATAVLRVDSVDASAELVGIKELRRRVARNLRRYAATLEFDPATRRPTRTARVVFALGVAALAIVLIRRREATEWFAAFTLVAIALYYVAQARLALAPAVLIVGACVEVLRGGLAALVPRRFADVVVVAAIALLAWSNFSNDFTRPRSREKYRELLALGTFVGASTTPDEVLGGDNSSAYALLLDRPVYGLQFLCNQRGVDAARDAIAQWRVERVIVQRDGPCAPLVADGELEGDFRELAVVRIDRGARRPDRGPGAGTGGAAPAPRAR